MYRTDEPDLSLVSMEALLAELFGRVDHGVVAFHQVIATGGQRIECRLVSRYKGDEVMCIGLAVMASDAIVRRLDASSTSPEGDPHEF